MCSCTNVTFADYVDPHADEICFKAVTPAIRSQHIAGEADVGRMRACHKRGEAASKVLGKKNFIMPINLLIVLQNINLELT